MKTCGQIVGHIKSGIMLCLLKTGTNNLKNWNACVNKITFLYPIYEFELLDSMSSFPLTPCKCKFEGLMKPKNLKHLFKVSIN